MTGPEAEEIGRATSVGRELDFRGVGTTTLRVDAASHAAFVDLSGDANPLHTDPLAARRLPFGQVAVHGVHLALLALDHMAADGTPSRVRATFRHPVGIGDAVDLTVDAGTCRLTVGGRAVADVRADPGGRSPSGPDREFPLLGPAHPPTDLRFDQIDGLTGSILVAGDAEEIAARFPHLPVVVAAELLAVTRLVGMHVPGLHSMLSSFDLTLDDGGDGTDLALSYRVTSVDDRFSKVVLRVDGPTVHGNVTAFVRRAPADQVVDTTPVVPDEFRDVRALVVGGSRGLGAAAVQLLAAGGADVRFTYHRGAADAARVAAAASGATAHHLDVLEAAGLDSISADGWRPTLVAWFASPPIFVGARDSYSESLRDRFRTIYVDAFLRAVERLHPDTLAAILWPSSEAVTTGVPGLAEYADAKRIGEQACRELAAAHPRLVVQAPRFPRLRTDQTASFVPVDADDPAPHVLAALRACAGRQPG